MSKSEEEFENWASFFAGNIYNLRKACRRMTEYPQEFFFRDCVNWFNEQAAQFSENLEAAVEKFGDDVAQAAFKKGLRMAYEIEDKEKEAKEAKA